jgi:hypothetical protein
MQPPPTAPTTKPTTTTKPLTAAAATIPPGAASVPVPGDRSALPESQPIIGKPLWRPSSRELPAQYQVGGGNQRRYETGPFGSIDERTGQPIPGRQPILPAQYNVGGGNQRRYETGPFGSIDERTGQPIPGRQPISLPSVQTQPGQQQQQPGGLQQGQTRVGGPITPIPGATPEAPYGMNPSRACARFPNLC